MSGSRAGLDRGDELPLRGEDAHPDVQGHEGAEHRPDLHVRGARGEEMDAADDRADEEQIREDRSRDLMFPQRRDPEKIVDEPADGDEGQAQTGGLPARSSSERLRRP